MKPISVLSLFDGMSCGRIALNKARIPIKHYLASEIKPHAIKVSKANWEDVTHIGDVTKIESETLPIIDLLIGGSPCQDFSIGRTGQGLARHGLRGERSGLFMQYLRLLEECDPKWFLLENVSMPPESERIISKLLGVSPIEINSNLVSYQNRKRLYWTNIPIERLPRDRGISFQDYKDTDPEYLDQFKCNPTPSRIKMWGEGINGKCPNVTLRDKVNCLTVKQDRWSNSGLVAYQDFCRYLTTRELEIAQTVPVGYCDCLTKNQAENVLGDGWTVDVIVHILRGIK